jgi:ferritin heavy chain
MLLKAVSSLSLLPLSDSPSVGSAKTASVQSVWLPRGKKGSVGGGAVVAQAKSEKSKSVAGVIFEPFEEVKSTLALVPQEIDQSLARHKYLDECEAAINEQIKYDLFTVLLFPFLKLCSLERFSCCHFEGT